MELLKVKTLTPTARLPKYGSIHAIGMDLYADNDGIVIVPARGRLGISTSICVEIPKDHYGRVAPRSGLAAKHGIDVLAGVIDQDYRGEIKVILQNNSDDDFPVVRGDRIAQLIIEKAIKPLVVEVTELSSTERGENGFGSTGV